MAGKRAARYSRAAIFRGGLKSDRRSYSGATKYEYFFLGFSRPSLFSLRRIRRSLYFASSCFMSHNSVSCWKLNVRDWNSPSWQYTIKGGYRAYRWKTTNVVLHFRRNEHKVLHKCLWLGGQDRLGIPDRLIVPESITPIAVVERAASVSRYCEGVILVLGNLLKIIYIVVDKQGSFWACTGARQKKTWSCAVLAQPLN